MNEKITLKELKYYFSLIRKRSAGQTAQVAISWISPSFHGGYRKPTEAQRELSRIDKEDFDNWFQQIWHITGASTKHHPAPFPLELSSRLVRMFSFHGDTVLDPFCGTGTTMIASLRYGRNSIGIDIEPEYCRMAARYLKKESSNLFFSTELIFEKIIHDHSGHMQVCEDRALYETKSARKTLG